MFNKTHLPLLVFFLLCVNVVFAQDFMMQAWYWDYPKDNCNGFSGNSWASTLNGQTGTLSSAGFTYLWLPPASRASFGSCSNGYDPQDLYDMGEFGLGPTGFGTRSEVDALISSLNTNNIKAVADVVYNHRDGGGTEDNSAVKDYITIHHDAGKSPFPSDRYRCRLPIGGSTGYGTGDYYFKISSKTGSFGGSSYKIYITTQRLIDENAAYLGSVNESEPNGGGDCGESNDDIQLNEDMIASVDGSGCLTDEFHLQVDADDFYASGDNFYIYLTNSGGYSDHRVYNIWYDNGSSAGNIDMNDYIYQTFTDFTNMPSQQGGMNFENFRPNSSNKSSTTLGGDWDWLWFFYDYDQYNNDTRDKLFAWTEWLWNDVGFRGLRMDAVKHFDPAFVGDLMDHLHDQGIDPGMVVGEYFDSNVGTLNSWVTSVVNNMDTDTQDAISIRAFDFGMREALKNACDQFGYDVRNVFNSGMVDGSGMTGFNVVTFVNNHDFRDENQPVQNDPMLGYAYILTNNQIGLPCVFYPDYFGSTIPHAPTVNLSTQIDELITAHKDYIFGSSSIDKLSREFTPYFQDFSGGFNTTTLFYQLMGGPNDRDVLVAINFAGETLNVTHGVNTGSAGLAEGDTFTKIAGDASATSSFNVSGGNVNISVPSRSYAVWVRNALLPLDLLDFSVREEEGNAALFWTTANERNVSGFEIQRSFDQANFEKIGWIDAKGLSDQENYTYIDQQLPVNQDIIYRLKIMDEDGQFEYSPLRSLKIQDAISGLHLTPNPTSGQLSIQFSLLNVNKIEVRIIDSLGRFIRQRQIGGTTGSQSIEMDVSDLAAGIYFLQLQSEKGSTQSVRFIKE